MITLKSAHEIELMRRAGKITAAARALAREMVKPGVTTHQIDKAVFDFIRFHGDCAGTYPCGKVSDEDMDLIRVTQESFFQGLQYAREGYRLSDISAAVQQYAESHGYSIVREYVGHGIGHHMHEPPEVPNFGKPGHGPRLLRGMTIAVEPMVNAGSAAIRQMPDGWTVKTADGKKAAHYENTILITAGDPELLTDASESLV